MNITGYTVDKLKDPTGILTGERYEFFLYIEVPEDDELYSENGLTMRVILAVEDGDSRIIQYHFLEQNTNKVLDFGLEDEEKALVTDFCAQNLEEK